MEINTYKFIQVNTEDKIKLNGLYLPGDKAKQACVFIHGFGTDFYSHNFYHAMARTVSKNNNAIILAQHRGTAIHNELLKTDGDSIDLGSFYEKIEEAHHDISAFVEFLTNQGYDKITLIGHSLGTIKAVRYLYEGKHKDKIAKLILISPFDKNAFMEDKAPGKWKDFVKEAEEKIKAGKGKEIVPVPEYEDFPLTWETFHSWYQQDDLSCMWDFYRTESYDFPALKGLKVPVKVILGDKDEFVIYQSSKATQQGVLDTIKKHIPDCETHLMLGANHVFNDYEDALGAKIVEYLD